MAHHSKKPHTKPITSMVHVATWFNKRIPYQLTKSLNDHVRDYWLAQNYIKILILNFFFFTTNILHPLKCCHNILRKKLCTINFYIQFQKYKKMKAYVSFTLNKTWIRNCSWNYGLFEDLLRLFFVFFYFFFKPRYQTENPLHWKEEIFKFEIIM